MDFASNSTYPKIGYGRLLCNLPRGLDDRSVPFDLLTALDYHCILLLTCTAKASKTTYYLAAAARKFLSLTVFAFPPYCNRRQYLAIRSVCAVRCLSGCSSHFPLSMRFCSWCISDKALRSDDEGDSDSVAGPSKTKNVSSSTNKAPIQVKLDVKQPEELFNEYADPEQENVMGTEGMERLCVDANIPMEGARPLLLAWQLNAKEMGTLTKDEWSKGMEDLKCVLLHISFCRLLIIAPRIANLEGLSSALADLEDLIILRKPAPKRPAPGSVSKAAKQNLSVDKYKKDRYWQYAADVQSSFLQFYMFCFGLVKKEWVKCFTDIWASSDLFLSVEAQGISIWK